MKHPIMNLELSQLVKIFSSSHLHQFRREVYEHFIDPIMGIKD